MVNRIEKIFQGEKINLFILKTVLDEMIAVGDATATSVAAAKELCTIIDDNTPTALNSTEKYISFLSMKWFSLVYMIL